MGALFTINHQKHTEICEGYDTGNCIYCQNVTSHGYAIEEESLEFFVNCCKRCEIKFNRLDDRIIKMLIENVKYYILKFGGNL